jgi:hypothetical protein
MVQTKEERMEQKRQSSMNWKNANKMHYDAYNREFKQTNQKYKDNQAKWQEIRKEYRAMLGLARNAELLFA